MDISGSGVLVLGGAGLVGGAICRKVLVHRPAALTVAALTEAETSAAMRELGDPGGIRVEARWGNVFVRREFKDLDRRQILDDPARRDRFIRDTLDPLDEEQVRESFLYGLIAGTRPRIVIDCVNTATALAYQDVFEASRQAYALLRDPGGAGGDPETYRARMETLIGTQYTPQLIRHVQILWRALCDHEVAVYLKVGTTGTGGMGLNIPYTHSEDKPSRVLLAKSALAGAHSMLLFLLGRSARESAPARGWSPDRNIKARPPVIKELKPAAAIGWKAVGFGPVRRKGRTLRLYDMPPGAAVPAADILRPAGPLWQPVGEEALQAPYIDMGENGLFSRGEFEAITDEGQMEFITPEEIADTAVEEILGGNSGSDIVSAFDSAVMGPTYRAGFLRARAVESLRRLEDEHGIPSVAFENLGPPRLSKLLYELHLILLERDLFDSRPIPAGELAARCERRVLGDAAIRARILSVGLAILLRDGRALRGPELIVPGPWEMPGGADVTERDIDRFARQGWLDLREPNLDLWIGRLRRLEEEAEQAGDRHSGSVHVRGRVHWEAVARQRSLGSVISWIFLREDDGERVKG